MSKFERFTIINTVVFSIIIHIWNYTFMYVFYILVYALFALTLILSLVFSCIFLYRVIRFKKVVILLYLFIASIPIIDIVTGMHDKIVDLFKPDKLIIATSFDANMSRHIVIRESNRFEYFEQTGYGRRTFEGNYIIKNDTLILEFENRLPNIIDKNPTKAFYEVGHLDLSTRNNTWHYFTTREMN